MVDSGTVLWGQTLVYTLYALAIISLVGWFAYNLTRDGKSKQVKPGLFWGFFTFLVVTGVSLHIITYNTIPWTATDLHGDTSAADKSFDISVADHEFALPSDVLSIDCEDTVLFNVKSEDLTYGFGLFRPDNSMVFQMQVVPGHDNELLWKFSKNGTYSIRSTEYSGPEGVDMEKKGAVEVTGCPTAS